MHEPQKALRELSPLLVVTEVAEAMEADEAVEACALLGGALAGGVIESAVGTALRPCLQLELAYSNQVQ